MDTLLLQYQQNDDFSLIKQHLLSFSLFSQMYHFIGQNLFNALLSYFQVQQVKYSDPIQINSKTIYIFMASGVLISKKQNKQTMQKYSRMSKKVKFSQLISKAVSQNNNRQSQKFKTVVSQQIINQSLFYYSSLTSNSNQYYISNQNKNSALIYLHIKSVPQQLLNQIRQKHHEKLKFLMTTQIFRNLQKHHVQPSLKFFELIKICFDEPLFKQNLRNTKIFVVMNGEVQLTTSQRKKKIKKGPTIILTQKNLLMGKSISESCVAFMIEREEVINILKKNMQGKYRNQQTEYYLQQIINHQKVYLQQLEHKETQKQSNLIRFSQPVALQQDYQKDFMISKRQTRGDTVPILKNRINQQNNYKIHNRNKTANFSQKKKFRIKEHFTNTINQHYKQYSQKKTQLLHKKGIVSNGILYSIKTLLPKQPNMQAINDWLKKQRRNKILKCKQNIMSTKQENLNLVNLRNYQQFQQSKIMSKIKNNMSEIIKKKQKKHFWKYPNSFAFDKFVQTTF